MKTLETLNEKQKQAVMQVDGPVRIIAGAGSGKTRVLTYRLAYLIKELGILPYRILAITFTNKAANEMKERAARLLETTEGSCFISTYHAFCVRVLREDGHHLGYPNNFLILDEDDCKSVLRDIYKQLLLEAKNISYSSSLRFISAYKTVNVGPDIALEECKGSETDSRKALIYKLYEAKLFSLKALDFDDLLLKTLILFENHPEVLLKWQKRFDYIHVDEFQDTNEIQYKLIKLLAMYHNNICVVGDPDQTIYSFRGANVKVIMEFNKDFPETKTITMDKNYRSTKTILSISNRLIKNNKSRLEKNLYTDNIQGENVIYHCSNNDDNEAKFVINSIKSLLKKRINPSDIAILYRANYLSRSIEQALLKERIAYRIYGGLKFFSRKEIKDILCYLRLISYEDDISFERVINVPARGIGKTTIEHIITYAQANSINYYQTIKYHLDNLPLRNDAKNKLNSFVAMIEFLKSNKENMIELFELIMTKTGYQNFLESEKEYERLENIQELKNSIITYLNQNNEATIENYLQDIALYTDQDVTINEDYISLMTIHNAKGLEYDYVFVIGLSEGVFPSPRALDENSKNEEEERRLAYVAFTRAKKCLYLSNNTAYTFDGARTPSRFIFEIGTENVNCVNQVGKPLYNNSISNKSYTKAVVNNYKKGDKVIHGYFGEGVVISINADTVKVAFSVDHGIKTIISSYDGMKKK